MANLTDLIADLRTDLSDPDASLFKDTVLERCVRKAAYKLSVDLKVKLTIENEQIEIDGQTRELLLLLGQIHACQVMRSATANAFTFSSGDKRVDKSKQPEHWAKLEADLVKDYRNLLASLKPDSEVSQDGYIITPSGMNPVIYERGSE